MYERLTEGIGSGGAACVVNQALGLPGLPGWRKVFLPLSSPVPPVNFVVNDRLGLRTIDESFTLPKAVLPVPPLDAD